MCALPPFSHGLSLGFAVGQAVIYKGRRFDVDFNAHSVYLNRAQAAATVTALLANFPPGQLEPCAGADVLFSLLSGHSWGLFTVAMVTSISIATEPLLLRGK